MPTLSINEIFYSIQGESTRAGLPCVFVRLRGCHLRCNYCDTTYAFHQGDPVTIDDIIARIDSFDCDLIEITGGEPLLQKHVHGLMTRLCDAGKTVLIETSGACDLSPCDPRVIRIVDLKAPGSGEADRNRWENIDLLTPADEVKIVVCDRADYEWARDVIRTHDLPGRVAAVLMSAAAEHPGDQHVAGTTGLSITSLAHWILEDRLPVRLQTQLHKLIWDPMARGV